MVCWFLESLRSVLTLPRRLQTFYRTLLDRIRCAAGRGIRDAHGEPHRLGLEQQQRRRSLDGAKLSDKFGPKAFVRSNDVGPDYFHVLGVPIIEGRDISEADTPSSLPVVVVNETFAKTFLPNTNPLGHKVRDNRTIVGVAKDSRYRASMRSRCPWLITPPSRT